ncbi:retrotransposon-related protein, partial [Trifolium pratense]
MESGLLKRPYNMHFKPKSGHRIAQYRFDNGNNQPVNPEFVNVVSETVLAMKDNSWVVDSGATTHICANKNVFTSYKSIGKGEECVTLSDSRTVVVLGKGKVNLKLTSGKILSLSKGFYSNGLFVLDVSKVMNQNVSHAYLVDSVDLWHEAKSTKKPCKPIDFRETGLLGLIHSDLGDLKSTMTRGDEAENKFKIYKAEVENKLNVKIKRLRTDRGGEYDSNSLSDFCEQNGIVHEVTPPYSPESNGIAERKNRTLKEMMNAMLLSSGAPPNLWGEAILSACHIQNRIIFKKTDKTPFELWEKRLPNLKYLKVWGCLAKVLLPEPKKRKIGSKTCDCMFIGYAGNSAAYRFLVLKSDVLEKNTIIESKNAEFFENVFPLKSKIEKSIVEPLCESNSCSNDFEREPRRSTRVRKETNLGDDFYIFLVDGDPLTYSEAISSPDGPFWKEAIDNEIHSIMSNHTWEIVDLPQGAKPIGCKWIFKKKLKPDGSVEKYKARLVAKGYTQKKGFDYFDTYSPVARMTSIRVAIALASIHNLVIHQMDVKTAFLNGDLEEEIYMDQPEGFVVPGKENKVCRLVKSLYGLKQAPKQWHEKFDKVMLLNGYKGYPNVLEGYSDANWISDSDETKSTSGFIFSLGGAVVAWKSSKQTCIARSTMEAEFIALDLAGSEAEWLRNLLA